MIVVLSWWLVFCLGCVVCVFIYDVVYMFCFVSGGYVYELF